MASLSIVIGLLGAIYGGLPLDFLLNKFGWNYVIYTFSAFSCLLALLLVLITPSSSSEESASDNIFQDLKTVLFNKHIILISFFGGLMVGPLEGFADGWAKAFLCEAYQMTGGLASSLSSLMFIGMGAGSFFLAYLLEKYPDKHYEVIIACSFAMIASFLLLFTQAGGLYIALPALLVIGFASGYQVITIYKAISYVNSNLVGLATAISNMIVMVFGYFFHTGIAKIIDLCWNGMVVQGNPVYGTELLVKAISIIPVCLLLAVFGFMWLKKRKELQRQKLQLQLIASENFASKAVMEAQGSFLTNKYAEGYPGKRYYCGCDYVDEVENLAIERLCKLFGVKFANVQPHSGSQANQAVFASLLTPGDTILGLSLSCGGHLTHGATPSLSGKWFKSVQYTVNKDTYLLNMDEIEKLALEHKPKLIIAGASAYPRKMDFKRFREIADKVGAYLLADIAHYAGLIAAGEYPSPAEYAHVMTSTTHKTLRGPRGGVVMTNDEALHKKIQSAVFPGLQGGPLMHVIAAKAVAFKEALAPEFKTYSKKIVENAKVLAQELQKHGLNIITGGTDSHIVLVDLRSQKLTGKDVVDSLERAGITCNKNSVPFDTEKPTITSGIRFGTAAETTRGLEAENFKEIASLVNEVVQGLISGNSSSVEKAAQ
ncbi:PREDICTED: serine hydroxymethyltransferase 1-like [Vollenhovia emeryi]|uniref:serine hydroxymethyltransferase 1-like n=1 Tax=Vollenhovia emeryi TaxID=411798 RepID=UPI0005F53A77|nr:PREDICTED: serine hydroxymethyltransferase 1-like [Vollenhovia emeryi]